MPSKLIITPKLWVAYFVYVPIKCAWAAVVVYSTSATAIIISDDPDHRMFTDEHPVAF